MDIDPNRESLTSTPINAIVSVFKAAFGNQEPTIADPDAEREGRVIVPRAFKDEHLNNVISEDSAEEEIMWFEFSGMITRLGKEAAAQGFRVGDPVCSLLRGYWSSRPRVHWTSAINVPEQLTFEEAADFSLAFATAYVSLYETARLQKDETILIHAATGGVSQAAVILAKHIGAEIYVWAGAKVKRDFMRPM
ncbi:hypothetical protein BDV12DRAFT_203811 [Aspergillus spectabilis]